MSAPASTTARGRARMGSTVGLHARPAAVIAQAVAASSHVVRVGRDGGAIVDARSPLRLISLGVAHGEELVVEAEGTDAEATLEQMIALLETDHDAED